MGNSIFEAVQNSQQNSATNPFATFVNNFSKQFAGVNPEQSLKTSSSNLDRLRTKILV